MSVKLTQLLCPSRHCIVALAWDDQETLPETVETTIRHNMTVMAINPWCGLCGSKDLHFETATTPWKTLKEAEPPLKAHEAEMIKVRMEFGQF